MTDVTDSWLPPLAAAFGVVGMVVIGGWLTEIGPWYNALRFPPWKPPNWAFGPIWTLILTLAAVAIVLLWRTTPEGLPRLLLVGLLLTNGVLNVLWNYLFFTIRRPDLAFFEVIGLWLSILAIIVFAAQYTTAAAWLFAPYLVWVGIAATLNRSIVRLNGPF
jgi:translocator protein